MVCAGTGFDFNVFSTLCYGNLNRLSLDLHENAPKRFKESSKGFINSCLMDLLKVAKDLSW